MLHHICAVRLSGRRPRSPLAASGSSSTSERRLTPSPCLGRSFACEQAPHTAAAAAQGPASGTAAAAPVSMAAGAAVEYIGSWCLLACRACARLAHQQQYREAGVPGAHSAGRPPRLGRDLRQDRISQHTHRRPQVQFGCASQHGLRESVRGRVPLIGLDKISVR